MTSWLRSTGSPLPLSTYWYLTRAPVSRLIQLKRTLAEDCPVEYSFTGSETRPKETVDVEIGRALMATIYEHRAHGTKSF